MNTDTFWQIVENSLTESGGDPDAQIKSLTRQLSALSPDEIVAFDREFDLLRIRAYTNSLWGAAYLINGGCSDDGFEYFRAWLIGQGRSVFETALANPDSLDALTDPSEDSYEFEDFLYLPRQVYKKVTGKEPDYKTNVEFKSEPDGEGWDFDDGGEAVARSPILHRAEILRNNTDSVLSG